MNKNIFFSCPECNIFASLLEWLKKGFMARFPLFILGSPFQQLQSDYFRKAENLLLEILNEYIF